MTYNAGGDGLGRQFINDHDPAPDATSTDLLNRSLGTIGEVVYTVPVNQTATDAFSFLMYEHRMARPIQVTAIRVCSPNTIATSANSRIWTLSRIAAAATGTATLAVLSTDTTTGTALTAFVQASLTLSSTASNLILAQGEQIQCVFTTAGSGVALSAGCRIAVSYRVL